MFSIAHLLFFVKNILQNNNYKIYLAKFSKINSKNL